MRRTLLGWRCRQLLRPAGGLSLTLTLVVAAVFVLAAVATGPVAAQTVATKKAAPAPPDMSPLARYVLRENLVFYLGSDGLDTQADAWKKTAAYKILTETPLGEMLEDMTAQLAETALLSTPNRKLNGADVVMILKHMARSGFVISGNTPEAAKGAAGPSGDTTIIVIRGGAGKDVRGSFGRLLGTFMGAKHQVVKKGSRSIVTVPFEVELGPKPPPGAAKEAPKEAVATNDATKDAKAKARGMWAWWSEGNDLVVTIGPGSDDVAIAVIDNKRPSALDHPVRLELARSEGGFTPIGQCFIDQTAVTSTFEYAPQFNQLASAGLKRVDFRWGFQDDALVSIARVKSPRPRRGLLAAFEQPSFDKAKLPPLPEGIESFTVVSVDPAQAFEQLLAAAPTPEAKAQFTGLAEALKTKARLDLRKDLLAHMGPKFAFYVLPGTATAEKAAEKPAEKAAEKAAPPPPGSGGAMANILGMSAMQLPRLTLVTEVDNTTSFARTLDDLMLAINKELKERAYDAAEKAPRPKAEAKGDQPKRRAAPPVMEFKLTPSKDQTERSYVLNIPPPLSRQFPPGLRLTVRLGNKQLAIATTPDAARQALEVKAGEWTPPADLVPALELLPAQLVVLGARDPRGSLPETLASLPGTVQRTVNTILASMQMWSPALEAPPGGGAGGAAGPAGAPPPPMPAATVKSLVFNIPVAKLPKPDDIRTRLFPAVFGISADDQEVRLTSRVAFPNIVSPSSLMGLMTAVPAILQARAALDDPAPESPAASKAGTSKTAKGASKTLVPKD